MWRVFGNEPVSRLSELGTRFRRAPGFERAGIVPCNLRHSCLTKLADAGVPDTTARAISGHRRDGAHRCHVITQTATKVAALAAMAATVERVRQGLGRGHMTLLQDHRRAVKYPTSLARRRSSVG